MGLLSKTVAEAHSENNLVSDLASIVRREMGTRGVISFRRFMELALYCPEIGYYERENERVGSGGDFVTSVSVGSLFGQLLAFQFASWCESFSGSVQWVESGAHDGRLAADMLVAVRDGSPELFERLDYCIIEPSARRQDWQRKLLDPFGKKVRWIRSVQDLARRSFIGVVFSNELLDAFPVHRLAWDAAGRRWFEWGVGCVGGCFEWRTMLEDVRDWSVSLAEAGFDISPEFAAVIPDGFTVEFSQEAGQWWRDAAEVLRCGRLMTIDYGSVAEEFLLPHRRSGTLRTYRRHSVGGDLLSVPGEQDLTAHVNFSQLIRAGEKAGLRTEALTSQSEFFANVARRKWSNSSPPSAGQIRQFQALTHPEHFGRVFQVLVQSRL